MASFVIISGDTLSSSTNGLSAFSTSFLSSSLLFRAVERSCNDSISAETVAKSLRKLVRFVSTELRISSQAVIERCRSSNLAWSVASAHAISISLVGTDVLHAQSDGF